MSRRLTVRGGGIAAVAATRIAREIGWQVDGLTEGSTRPPAWVLGPSTCKLLRNLFGSEALANGHLLRRHSVTWGDLRTVRKIPSMIVDSDQLCRALQAPQVVEHTEPSSWVIETRPPRHKFDFGQRIAIVARHELRDVGWSESSSIESSAEGWTFFAAIAPDRCVVQVTALPAEGRRADELLKQAIDRSPLLRRIVGEAVEPATIFSAAGYARLPFCEGAQLCCGSGAFRVDPICGDGVGYAVRSALWALSIPGHADAAGVPGEAGAAYEWRLRTTLKAHLRSTADFYATAKFGAEWDTELARLAQAERWLEPGDPTVQPFLLSRSDRLLQLKLSSPSPDIDSTSTLPSEVLSE